MAKAPKPKSVPKLTKEDYVRMVDELGELNAQKSKLEERINLIKETHIKPLGLGRLKGELFETNCFSSDRKTVDYKSIADDLAGQLLDAGLTTERKLANLVEKSTTVTPIVTLKVQPRTAEPPSIEIPE